MNPTSIIVLEKRNKALTWLWWAFWGKWILTTVLGIFFLLALVPCLQLLSEPGTNLWSLIAIQALLSFLIFGLALALFSFLIKSIREGKRWPLYLLGMYEGLLIYLLGTETMGYSSNPQHGIDILDVLATHQCNEIPRLYMILRFSMALIMACVCLGAYACFILFKYPLEVSEKEPGISDLSH